MRMLVIFTALLGTLLSTASAGAQTDKVFDALGDLLRGGQQLRGNLVAVRGNDLVVRARDDRTYVVSASGLDLSRLQTGQALKIDLRRGSDSNNPTAAAIHPDSGTPRTFRTVSGTVESTAGNQIQFRTSDGTVVPIDLGQIVGPRPSLAPGSPATVTYEQTGSTPVAMWVEPGGAFGSAYPQPSGAFGSASPRTTGPMTGAGGYQRLHGFVESIGIGSFTLKADDGQRLDVDASGGRGATDLRPGDLVSVVGRSTSSGRFAAELVQKDATR